MPYVYAQAKDSSERGLPMVRALFIEYPNDPGSWQVDDEYLFGSDILVAPLMEAETAARDVTINYAAPGVRPGNARRVEVRQPKRVAGVPFEETPNPLGNPHPQLRLVAGRLRQSLRASSAR